jgi:diguanylate cyclase (GGDEF)-like protein
MESLRQALFTSQREARAARNVIRKLEAMNSQLDEKLTQLEQNEAKAWTLAYYDELTGLPNRRLLRDRLGQAIAQSARQKTEVALLFVDLDGFKSINDRLGHAAGDRLLQLVAERLTTAIRAADTACRYGGDEFVVLLPGLDHPTLCAAVASKVLARIREPYVVDGCEIRVTASVGAASYPMDGDGHEELLAKADEALYSAKSRSCEASIRALESTAAANHDSWALP